MNFFSELRRRNRLLFWFGLFNLAVAIVCLALMPLEETKRQTSLFSVGYFLLASALFLQAMKGIPLLF